jgi:hypothetical protein
MKKFILGICLFALCTASRAQFIATMEITDTIPGLCNAEAVYVVFPGMQGQVQALCPVPNYEILRRLNEEVTILKTHPKYKGKGMISLIINCKGIVVQCKMDKKTNDPELDKQIEAVFNSLGEWKAAKVSGLASDSGRLFSFEIKKGVFTFD